MSFKMLRTTHPMTEHHISEDLKPKKRCCENLKSFTVTSRHKTAVDSKDAVPFNKWLCFINWCESSPSCGWNCMSVHKTLSPLFIRFNTSSLFAWTKTIHSTGTQDICNPTGQGIFWSHHYKTYIVLFTPWSNSLHRKNALQLHTTDIRQTALM
jgi:hypothetical protein